MDYGEELKYHRLKLNKSLRQLENETGISNENLSRWERNLVSPSIENRSEERRVGKECL